MKRVEEDTHEWDFEWQDTALESALPPAVATNSHFCFIGNERKKIPLLKKLEVKRSSDSCRKISHLDEGTSNCSTGSYDSLLPPDRRQLFRRPSPQIWGWMTLSVLPEEKRGPPVKVKQLLTHSQWEGIVKRVQKDKKKTRSWTYSVALRQLLLWRSSELVSVAIIGNEGIQSVSDKRGLKAANGPGAKMTVTASLSKSGLKIQ